MHEKQISAQKWIADAAYFNYLNHDSTPNQQLNNWLGAEVKYYQLLKNRIKSGLVRMDPAG